MEVLSEVLKGVKLRGALFYNRGFSYPWCVNASSARALARQFAPGAEHVIIATAKAAKLEIWVFIVFS